MELILSLTQYKKMVQTLALKALTEMYLCNFVWEKFITILLAALLRNKNNQMFF